MEMFFDEHVWELIIMGGTALIVYGRMEARLRNTPTKVEHAEMQGEIDVLDTSVITLVKTTDRMDKKLDRLLERD